MIVCWKFELLPYWALIALAVREVATLVLARLALRSGVDLEISWIGRLATLFTFGGLFWTLVFDSWITVAMFLIGVDARVDRDDPLHARLAPLPGRAGEADAGHRQQVVLKGFFRTLKLNLTFFVEAYTRER